MAADLLVVGLSHHTAPIQVREKLAFTEDALAPALRELGSLPTIGEAMLVSTCNRVEVYAAARGDAPAALADIRHFLARSHNLDAGVIGSHLYDRVGPEAVTHVFRV